MRTSSTHRTVTLAVVVLALATPAALAGGRHRVIAKSTPAVEEPVYDKSHEVTVKGIIQDIREGIRPGRLSAQQIVVQTESGPVTIELGPSSFMKARDFAVTMGDALELVGAMVHERGLVLAREVQKDGQKLELRDEDGRPVWLRAWNRVRRFVAGN